MGTEEQKRSGPGRPRIELDIGQLKHQYLEQGLSLEEIGRLHGTSLGTVRARLFEAGIDPRPRQRWAKVDVDEALAMKAVGVPVGDIAAYYGVSEQTMYRRFGGDY